MPSVFLSPHKKIIIVFSGLVVLVLIGTIFGLFQTSFKTTITITPQPNDIDTTFKAQIGSAQNNNSITGKVFETIQEAQATKKAEATVSMEDYAEGTIHLNNTTWNTINFVAGTRFKSPNGLIYRAVNRIHIPSKGETDVLVRADKMGGQYDIGPTTFTIPGLQSQVLKEGIIAKSSKPMTGGVKESGVVMQADITNAYNELKDQLYNTGLKEIKQQIPESGFQVVVKSEVVDKSTNVTPGDERSQFKVNMKLKVGAVAVKESNLLDQAKKVLQEKIKKGEKLAAIEPDSLSYRLISYNAKNNQAQLEVQLRGYTTITKDASLIDKSKIKSQDIKEVKNYLLSFKEIKNVNISIWPPIIKRQLPNNPEKINIKILNIK